MLSLVGDSGVRALSKSVEETVTSLAILKGYGAKSRTDKLPVRLPDGSRWRYVAASTLTGDDKLVVTPADAPAAGRYVRDVGPVRVLLPFTFATADAAVLLTVPAGFALRLEDLMWYLTTGFTGGTSSAIGASSGTKTGYTTKGDLLGGATGDVAATLVTTGGAFVPGTIGAGFDTLAKQRKVLNPADTLRFDRITSAFTAGAGGVLVKASIVASPASPG